MTCKDITYPKQILSIFIDILSNWPIIPLRFLHIIKISCDVAFKEENVLLLYMFGMANTICADFKRMPPL